MACGTAWARAAWASFKVAGTRVSHLIRVGRASGGCWRCRGHYRPPDTSCRRSFVTGQYGPDDCTEVLPIAGIATERLHEHGNTRLVLDHQLQHDLVEVGPMIPAIPLGDVHDVLSGLRIAVIAPIDMKARRIEMGIGRTQSQPLAAVAAMRL